MSDDIDQAKVSVAPSVADDADTFLYDYFKHLTSLSVLTLGGVLAISSGSNGTSGSRASMILVVVLVSVAALFAFTGTGEIVRQKATGETRRKTLTFYRIGAPISLSLGVGGFLYLFLKGFPV